MKPITQQTLLTDYEKKLLKRCKLVINDIDPAVEVILYGSRARGDAHPESDYDLLILTDKEANLEKEDAFRRKLFPIELETGAVLTVFLISKENWNSPLYAAMPFYQNVKREGIFL